MVVGSCEDQVTRPISSVPFFLEMLTTNAPYRTLSEEQVHVKICPFLLILAIVTQASPSRTVSTTASADPSTIDREPPSANIDLIMTIRNANRTAVHLLSGRDTQSPGTLKALPKMYTFLGARENSARTQALRYVGIPSWRFFPSAQRNTQWCWAASIQMVLNHWGIYIEQADIVSRSYGIDPHGNLPNLPAPDDLITANLNNWSIDRFGRPYVVTADYRRGAPHAPRLMEELERGHPVIVAYRSGVLTGHAVVVTAAGYSRTRDGTPILRSVVVRDPFPTPSNRATNGRNEYSAQEFFASIIAHWYVRVSAGR